MLRWFRAAGLLGPREGVRAMAPLGGIQRGVSRPGLSSSIAGKTEEGNLEVSGRRGCCDHCGNQPSHGRPPNADKIDCHRRWVQDRAYCDAREPDDLLGPVWTENSTLALRHAFSGIDRRWRNTPIRRSLALSSFVVRSFGSSPSIGGDPTMCVRVYLSARAGKLVLFTISGHE